MADLLRPAARVGGALLLTLGLALPASADREHEDEPEHERAREAVERGEALPLVEILARVGPQLGGEVVGVSFEREHGRWVYEFKVVRPSGQLVEVYVDAASAQVLEWEVE